MATDGVNETPQAVAITVTNVNDNNPVFTSPDAAEAAENQRLAYTAAATDADGDGLSYSLSGTDAALFTIDPNTGAVRFIASPDFETPGDTGGDNVYNITVTATDGATEVDHAVALTVTNVDDNAPSFSSDATVSVAENETPAYTAMATDADGSTLTYSLSGGADAALFTIDGTTGQVSFNTPPDFEAPGSADGDNDYEIMVTVSDGVTTDATLPVTITVSNINDNDPVFTSPATAGVAENQLSAYTARAGDADGDPLSYSLSGADAARFTINPNTGVISFAAAPDFEAPGDVGGDNDYEITVTASDGVNSADLDVVITVTDENEVGNAPAFTSPVSVDAAENQTPVYTALADRRRRRHAELQPVRDRCGPVHD